MSIRKSTTAKLSTNEKKNFGLKEPEFSIMLKNMQAGDDRLFEQVFLSHFKDCMSYLTSTYKISQSEAYDASMDALLAFRKRMLDGKVAYGNMRFLLTKMASQFLMASKKKATIQYLESKDQRVKEEPIDNEIMGALDKAWDKLPSDNRILLEQFYYKKTPLKMIAATKNITEAAMRKQKQRSMEKLKKYLVEYLPRTQ